MIIENKKGGRLNEKVVYKNWLLVCRFYGYSYWILPFGNVCTLLVKEIDIMETNVIYMVTIILECDYSEYYLFSTLDLAKEFARTKLNSAIEADNFDEVSIYIHIDRKALDTYNPIN